MHLQQTAGQTTSKSWTINSTRTAPKSQLDYVKDAAKHEFR